MSDAPVRVLVVIPGLGIGGGAERSLLEVAPRARVAGVELEVAYFVDRPSSAADRFEALGIRLHRIGGRTTVARALELRRLIRARRPDVVHSTLFEADLACAGAMVARRGRPVLLASVVSTSYGPARRQDPAYVGWRVGAVRRVHAAALRRADRVHANSQAVRSEVVDLLHVRPERVVVIPRGRDPELLRPLDPAQRAEVRRELAIPDGAPLLVAVGRHEYQKAPLDLVRAVHRVRVDHPDVRLAVLGREGAMTAALREEISSLGLEGSALLLGFRGDVPAILGAADAFVCASISEGLPGAVLEAMALEVPIASTDIAPVLELLDRSTAWLAPAGRPEALAAAIVDLLADPAVAERRAVDARSAFLAGFTIDRSAAALLELYRSLA